MKTKTVYKNKDELIMLAIRLWFSGAIAFMLLFGANISFSTLDLIIYLSLVHYLVERFIVSWISRESFKTRMDLWPIKNYKNSTILTTVFRTIINIILNMIFVILLILVYRFINILINNAKGYGSDVVKFPVEPFGYTIIFNTFYYTYYFIKYYYYKNKFKKQKEKKIKK